MTRERAVQGAIRLADENGLESLSMRKLATELGIEAMSLYYHVKNKEDILDGMVDGVFEEIPVPHGAEWKPAMRDHAQAVRRVLTRHPWAISLVDTRTSPGVATLGHLDAVIGFLLGSGFSMGMAAHTMSLLDSYAHGFALQESSLPVNEAGDISAATEGILAQENMMSQAFPHLAAMAEELVLRPGYAYGNEFEFGLRVILDGIEAAHRAEVGGA